MTGALLLPRGRPAAGRGRIVGGIRDRKPRAHVLLPRAQLGPQGGDAGRFPRREVALLPEVSGEVVKLGFREGAVVRKGDLLLAIKPDNYQAQVEQQEAGLAAAKAVALQAKASLLKAEEDLKAELKKQQELKEKKERDANRRGGARGTRDADSGSQHSHRTLGRRDGEPSLEILPK